MTLGSKNHERKIQRKQKRLQHLITNDSGVICCDTPTKNLAICNAGLSTGLDQIALVTEFMKFGKLFNVYMQPGKSYCFVICTDELEATNIYNKTHGKSHLGQNDTVIYLSYCENIPMAANQLMNDVRQQILPPGLIVIENFITSDEEDILINLIKWKNGDDDDEFGGNSMLKHRQVKHFGYEFRYDTNNVDLNQPLIDEPIPNECDFLWDRLRDQHSQFFETTPSSPHQLTVNKYEPGQGIPSHVDTHSAFTSQIISLSLASDVVMEFRKPTKTNSKEYLSHISVTLPRRSLLIMCDEVRYGWKHGITPRKIDVIRNANGHLTAKYRTKRISYTFRWLSTKPCHCEYHSLCDTYQKSLATTTTTETSPIAESKKNPLENPSLCELENVHKVYNEIANHFSETRHSPWPQVNQFIQQFEMGSVLVDIGCGNGKYLQSNQNIFEIGCDRSEGLLNVCRERQFNIFQCDCLAVPIRSNSVDGCISIAVIHHLASEERRMRAIKEMIRILRPMGRALIYVWAKNQALQSKSTYLLQNKRRSNRTNNDGDDNDDDDSTINTSVGCNQIDASSSTTTTTTFNKLQIDGNSKQTNTSTLPIHTNRTEFEHTDILVPWKLKKNLIKQTNAIDDQSTSKQPQTFLRFYHVFDESELERMCQQFSTAISIEKSYYDQGNWCVIFQKQ